MSDSPKSRSPLSAQQLLTVTETLNRVVEDRSLLLHLTREQQMLFLRAAEQVAHPDRSAKRQMLRALRTEHRKKRDERKQRDQALLDRTGIRQLTPVCRLDQLLPTAVASSSSAPEPSANRDDSEMTLAVGRLQEALK